MKQISIAAAMVLVVASGAAMAESQKRFVLDRATHRAKSPQHSKKVPNSYEEKLRQYEEDKRNGWYKIDSA